MVKLISNKIIIRRLEEIRKDNSIGKSEKELNNYLKKRGVNVESDN